MDLGGYWGGSKLTGGADVVVDGRALVSHYAFGVQSKGLEGTDVLKRYKAYARSYCGTLLSDGI